MKAWFEEGEVQRDRDEGLSVRWEVYLKRGKGKPVGMFGHVVLSWGLKVCMMRVCKESIATIMLFCGFVGSLSHAIYVSNLND